MSMDDNIKYSRHKEIKNIGYRRYDNFDGIDVPFTDGIPKDYDDLMGVPITFLGKYCPEQFEIIGNSSTLAQPVIDGKGKYKENPGRFYVNGKRMYDRIVIKRVEKR